MSLGQIILMSIVVFLGITLLLVGMRFGAVKPAASGIVKNDQ
jgi:hypothetical protein